MPYDTFNTYGGAAAMHEDTATTKAAPSEGQSGGSDRKIRFMVMSGFLGAGKTTTMIALGEYMNKTYGKVGMSDIPGLGVGALDHVYHRLVDDCADWITLSPFTVLVDPERIKLLLPEGEDINLPEEIKYLMQLQLEEADLIVLNKIDVMTPEEVERDVAFLREACPDIPVMTISALRGDGIPELAEYLETHESLLKNFSVRDNEKFQEAEKTLTWYNRRLFFKQLDDEKIDCNAVIDELIEEIRMGLIEKKRNVPHLKTFATAGAGDFNKCSLLGIDYDIEHTQPFLRKHKKMSMIINARAVCESRPFARIVDDAVDFVCDKYNLDAQVFFTECFNLGDEGR